MDDQRTSAGSGGRAGNVAYTLFDTAIGRCGVAWTARGIRKIQLPEPSDAALRSRLLAACPDARHAAPSGPARQAVARIVAHLQGRSVDLSAIALDMAAVPAFHRRVYEAARAVAAGDAIAYGELAARVGSPGAARAVGQAMRRNPFPIVVPCHRVLAAGGKPGGFSADGGLDTKARLLAIEGVALPRPGGLDAHAARARLAAADRRLARLMERIGPFRLEPTTTPSAFVALAEAIVYQQLTGKAAATIFGRLQSLDASGSLTPDAVLAAAPERLRAVGLSAAKAAALRDLAEKTRSGLVPSMRRLRTMTDEAIVDRLTRVRGVGRWTVEMLLIFRLGRPDVLPADDYGIRKGFAIAFGGGLPPPRAVAERGQRWRPHRTIASWYLWRAVDSLDDASGRR